mgnify:CR=1 FL=1
MINGQSVLAVIPARSGSVRCPGKNFLHYKGKTLVEWAHEAAAASRYIDRVVLSTDKERPIELCTDDATCEDVLRFHHKDEFWCVLLQPTSPNRTSDDIDRTIEKAVTNGLGAISTYLYKTNGAVYVASWEWLKWHDFSHAGLSKYEMPEERSLDINYAEDFAK